MAGAPPVLLGASGGKVTSSYASPREDGASNVVVASHGSPMRMGAICGTVGKAESIGAARFLLHTPMSSHIVLVLDVSIIGAHLRRAQETLYRGIKGPTSHLVNQHALNWIMERLWRLPRRVWGLHRWVVRQSSHLAAVSLDELAAHTKAPPVHLLLPKEHATLLVPRDDGVFEPHVPSMQALQQSRRWSRSAHQGPTRRWQVVVRRCLWERCIMALRTDTCCGRGTVASLPCKSCDCGSKKSRIR